MPRFSLQLAAMYAAAGAAALAAPSSPVDLAPVARPGFYGVAGGAACLAAYGPMVFLPQRPRTLVMAGGLRRPIVLASESEVRHVIVGSGCTLDFRNNDLRTVGVCLRPLSHRGDARRFPANTLPAFQDALAQGFAGVELDVHLSRDAVPIVSHDDNLAVATDCRGSIAATHSDAIANCRALRSPLLPETRFLADRATYSAAVPTLRTATERLLGDPRVDQLVIDIKIVNGGERMAEALAAALPRCDGPRCREAQQRRLTFISSDRADLAILERHFRFSHRAYEDSRTVSGLIDDPDGDHWSDRSFDTFSLSFNSLFDPRLKLVKLVRGENLTPVRRFNRLYANNLASSAPRRLLGWTVNSNDAIRALRRYAFADILTDLSYERFVRQLLRDVSRAQLVDSAAQPPRRTVARCG